MLEAQRLTPLRPICSIKLRRAQINGHSIPPADKPLQNERPVLNVYMLPVFFCSGTACPPPSTAPWKVVLPRPYITLTWVHSLKRPDETPSQDDDMFAIPVRKARERLFARHCQRSGSLNVRVLHPKTGFICGAHLCSLTDAL